MVPDEVSTEGMETDALVEAVIAGSWMVNVLGGGRCKKPKSALMPSAMVALIVAIHAIRK